MLLEQDNYMKIALIPERFQPLTLAHYEMIKSAIGQYVIGGGSGKAAQNKTKNPIPVNIRTDIIESVFTDTVIVKNFTSTNLDFISDEIIEEIPEGKHSLVILAGSDRSTYDRQLKYINPDRLTAKVVSFGEERESEEVESKYLIEMKINLEKSISDQMSVDFRNI